VAGARAALAPVLAERDRCRGAKTEGLHRRLLDRMAGVGAGQATEWDPETEETRLRRAEPGP
jgi:hypothetical protein